jgi:Tol biopolymer transport system component
MSRKHWIVIGISSALACLLVVGLGAVFVVKNVPGIARLVYGGTRAATTVPLLQETRILFLPTATLTPVPTSPAPEATPTELPRPTVTPSAALTDDQPSKQSPTPAAVASSTPTPQQPTATSQPPTPTPRPQWIAFETKRGSLGDYEIFVVAPDGSRLNNLTNSWADDVAPVWSPDGRHIVFVSFRDTLAGKWGLENGSIYIMDFDPQSGTTRGNVVRLTDDKGNDGWPTWSPDGQRIAFHSDRGGRWDIWIINTDGSGLTNLTNQPTADRYPDWSPDGKKIAFTSKRGGNEDIWVMSVPDVQQGTAGSQPINLTKAPDRDRYAIWSPDGRKLTFSTNRDGNYEVYVMNADGSNPKNVSQSPKSTEGLADWSPDGKYLVLYSDRTGNKEVFVVDLGSGRWTNITNHPASDEFCSWSP